MVYRAKAKQTQSNDYTPKKEETEQNQRWQPSELSRSKIRLQRDLSGFQISLGEKKEEFGRAK